MANWTEETMSTPLVPNTTMVKRFLDGVLKVYKITPAEGYVLHDSRSDEEVLDPATGEPTGEIIYRYATGTISVAASYDFTQVVPDTITDLDGNTIAVNKIGAFGLFAVPTTAVPENNTYGGVENDHETI